MDATTEILDFCTKMKINLEQFFVLHLLSTKQTTKIRLYSNTFKYKNGKFLTQRDKDDLIKRKFLIEVESGKFTVSDKFKQRYFDIYKGGNELFNLYPGFIRGKGGNWLPLAGMDKVSFRLEYYRRIGGSRAEHEEVLKDLQYGLDNNLITFGIKKFLESEYWNKLRKLRLTDKVINVNTSTQTEHEF